MLKGKVALITGASRGIGRAIAIAFAREGAQVAIVYAGNHVAAEETVKKIQELGARCSAYICDVSDFDAVKTLVKRVEAEYGSIDILVNNAGITADGLCMRMKEADFDHVISVNLKGAFNMIRHAAGIFLKKRSGKIINITSVIGLMGNAGQANYAAAKAGIIGLTKSVAKEFAGRGVTCNAIAPGYIDTDMTKVLPENAKQAMEQLIPMKRSGSPEDVAELAVFLASDKAAYITGDVIAVDGGLSM